MDKTNNCRVCGYDLLEPPWGINDDNPIHVICPCCGAHVGLDDETYQQVIEYRKKWLEDGAKWKSRRHKPDNWNLEEQLKGIPDKYL